MMRNNNIIVTILIVLSSFITVTDATGCFRTYESLNAIETRRGANNTVPVTRVICSNSVFLMGDEIPWWLNGNTNYLCGPNGASTNNCTVLGGNFQLDIGFPPFGRSSKDNILLSGFTFESAKIASAIIAAEGKFTIRDCIFKNHNNHGVFAAAYFGGPPLLDNSTSSHRNLAATYVASRLQQHRQLLIGGGSEPRSTIHFDRCQFLNNSLTSDIFFPTLASNGPIDIVSSFADVTVSNSLFKDNYFEYNFDTLQDAFLIKVKSSSTVNITNSCFINNYVSSTAPVDIIADSGLVATRNNFVTDTPFDADRGEPISPCQYLVLKEAYKCVAPEASVCRLPACAASFTYYKDSFVQKLINGGANPASPCDFNIKVDLPCAQTGKSATLQLIAQNNTIIRTRTQIPPFFLYAQSRNGTILGGTVALGTYKVQALVDGIIQPSPTTFTFSRRCLIPAPSY